MKHEKYTNEVDYLFDSNVRGVFMKLKKDTNCLGSIAAHYELLRFSATQGFDFVFHNASNLIDFKNKSFELISYKWAAYMELYRLQYGAIVIESGKINNFLLNRHLELGRINAVIKVFNCPEKAKIWLERKTRMKIQIPKYYRDIG